MHKQLSLGLRLRDDANFENWYIGDNQQLTSSLKELVQAKEGGFTYIWGKSGAGKTHLLQAAAVLGARLGSAFYLPLGSDQCSPAILENLDSFELLCIDNVHCVAAEVAWEEALFHFFNRSQSASLALIISANVAPTSLNLILPDLRSRFSSGLTYQVNALGDEQKLAALQMRAKNRGFCLTEEVGNYLLTHYSRDTTELFNALELLDQASLQAKHRLTIPFLKSVLGSEQ